MKMGEISMMRFGDVWIGRSLAPVSETTWTSTEIENANQEQIARLAVAKLKILDSKPHA